MKVATNTARIRLNKDIEFRLLNSDRIGRQLWKERVYSIALLIRSVHSEKCETAVIPESSVRNFLDAVNFFFFNEK